MATMEDIKREQEYHKKHYDHEVFLYGEDIVTWSLIRELEKIKRILEGKETYYTPVR